MNLKDPLPTVTPTAETKKPRARPKAEQREETKAVILDAAEKLFAMHGRDGVTLRAIATASNVDTALVHYHFSDLEGVFGAVLMRKSEEINNLRNRAMDDYLAVHGSQPSVEGVFDAFLRPMFGTIASDTAYWGHYAAIIGHINSSRVHSRTYMNDTFNTTVHRFIEVLIQLAPNVPKARIYWLYHLISGSLTLSFAQTGRIDNLSKGLCDSSDLPAILESMTQTYVGGFNDLRARYQNATGN
ncbi:MAG: TetR/AcrR family transcriptional regulator [Pseudomonadota bacterium]